MPLPDTSRRSLEITMTDLTDRWRKCRLPGVHCAIFPSQPVTLLRQAQQHRPQTPVQSRSPPETSNPLVSRDNHFHPTDRRKNLT
ncbi:hypothetical protein RRG08_056099 [Elysia crispata]|uniref:Uncharacterized protein n=1 Tax=Elysia crispata TaxID=231223 RepID=A0AAE1DE03_9GAST|nr:hypothetical protein RRG08_056099 [Elysia crispata]